MVTYFKKKVTITETEHVIVTKEIDTHVKVPKKIDLYHIIDTGDKNIVKCKADVNPDFNPTARTGLYNQPILGKDIELEDRGVYVFYNNSVEFNVS